MPKSHCCNTRLARGDIPIGELDLDPIEFAFLTASRYFCLSFAEPQQQSWVLAFLSSSNFFPAPNSAESMRCVLAIVHEMRTSRRSVFRFSNPRCEGCAGIVTHDERHLVQFVRALRQSRTSAASSSAMLLCEGNDTARLQCAVEDFCSIYPLSNVLA